MTNTYQNELPDPADVLEAAESEMPQRMLDDYTDAIRTLREKNFTFREIAEWLKKFGFAVDHNAVYRAYARTVSDHDLRQEEEADERQAQDDADRDIHLNGPLVAARPSPASETPAAVEAKAKGPKAARAPAKHKKQKGK